MWYHPAPPSTLQPPFIITMSTQQLRYHQFQYVRQCYHHFLSFLFLFLFIMRVCVFNKTTYQKAHLWMIFRLNLEYCRELWSQLKVCVTKVRYVLSCTFRLLLLKVFSMRENKLASHTVEFNGKSFCYETDYFSKEVLSALLRCLKCWPVRYFAWYSGDLICISAIMKSKIDMHLLI